MTNIYIYIYIYIYTNSILYANVSFFPIWPANFREFLGQSRDPRSTGPLEPSPRQAWPVPDRLARGFAQDQLGARWWFSHRISMGWEYLPSRFPWIECGPLGHRSCREIHTTHGCSWVSNKIFFIFTPNLWGNDPIWGAYFSIGLKPPTSFSFNDTMGFLYKKTCWARSFSVGVFFFFFGGGVRVNFVMRW